MQNKPKPSLFSWYRRQRNIVKLGIGCPVSLVALFLVLFLVAFVIALVHPTPQTQTAHVFSSTPTPTATTKPISTIAPTSPILTPTPTAAVNATHPTPTAVNTTTDPFAAVPGDTVLGQPISHFVAKYGQATAMDANTSYDFSNHTLTVFAYKSDSYLVSIVLYSGTDNNGWDSQESAANACRVFLPGDADYKRTVDLGTTGFERVYLSQSVAPLFPASQFTDENANVTTPGTIAIVYDYDMTAATQRIISCSVQVGLQTK